MATARKKPTRQVPRDQVRALRSPTCQEIVDALGALGPATVADLGAHLGRAPDSLYYHLRTLARVGLVEETKARTGATHGRVYRATCSAIDTSTTDWPGRARDVGDVIAAALRIAERETRIALEHENRTRAVAATGGRLKGWLTRTSRTELEGLLERARTILTSGRRTRGAELVTFTHVLSQAAPAERAATSSYPEGSR